MYQALYRKWRPQTFDDVIGQKHITDSLKNQVSSGHLSHAYLFIGTRGTGKTSCARILAKAVNCENPVNGNPCGKCAACTGIADGRIMDIVELDAASNNSVDNVRALRDEAVFSPADLKKRVYIIDEVHMLSTSAFNALLKIIEEPPDHLMFILATTELQKVPATILSRCQRHSFKRIERHELTAYIENIARKENIEISADAADLIAGLSEGGVRDALSMLDQCSAYGSVGTEQVYSTVGLAGNLRISQLFSFICSHDPANALSLFDTLWRDGKDPASLVKELSGFVRDILIYKLAPKSASALIYGGYDSGTLNSFASALSADELYACLDSLQEALRKISLRMNPKMTVELCIASLCRGIDGDSTEALKARIARLEKTVDALSSGGISFSAAVPAPSAESRADHIVPTVPVVPATLAPSDESEADPIVSTFPVSSAHSGADPIVPTVPTEPSVTETPAAENVKKATDPAAGSAAELWSGILNYVKEIIPRGAYQFISNPELVDCSIDGDMLFVNVEPGNPLALSQASKDDVVSKLQAAASTVLGKSFSVRVRSHKLGDFSGQSSPPAPVSVPSPVSSARLPAQEEPIPSSKERGDLNELRAFKEVVFK